MKNVFLFAIVTGILFLSCESSKDSGKSSFTINVEIKGVEDNTPIYLQLIKNEDLHKIDSANLISSKVSFTGSFETPEMVFITIGETRKMVNLFAENAVISVVVDVENLDKAQVSGSKSHDDMMVFKKYMEPIDKQSSEINEEYRNAVAKSDNDAVNALRARFETMRLEQIAMFKKFISDHSKSFLSPFIIRRYLGTELEYKELDEMLSQLSPSVHSSKDYQELKKQAESLKSTAIGMPAADFALNDSTGNPIAISSFKGKILLIDFWASWCGPCRRENPNVVRIYNDYKDKGFEIIGVSFDESKSKWIDAIHQDQLTWPHISDLKGWQSYAAKLYSIQAIPATILLDREGIIIAKNLRGEALREKLEEIYKQEG